MLFGVLAMSCCECQCQVRRRGACMVRMMELVDVLRQVGVERGDEVREGVVV